VPDDERPFREPKLNLSRIYTRAGDEGETSLVGGQRVLKDSLRIECYGAVDELNAFIGMARATAAERAAQVPEAATLVDLLFRVQNELFNLGSLLATLPEDVGPQQPRVTDREVARLEREIDAANEYLVPLKSFVLPGGSRLCAELHICRTVCRRAERLAVALSRKEQVPREVIRYLNRLSDALFVWSRWANRATGVPESLWDPNQPASGH